MGLGVPRWVARVAVLGVATSFSLLGSEVAVRIAAPQTLNFFDNTRDRLTIHPPGLNLFLYPFGHRVRFNSHGMRDLERLVDKAPNVSRLMVLGDSFMEAVQVPFAESFPARLQRALDPERMEVINASVGGWSTDEQLTWFLRYGQRFSPDVVLLAFTIHNDVAENLAMEFHDFDGVRIREKPRLQFGRSRYLILKVKAWLASRSHLYRLAYNTFIRQQIMDGATELDRHVTQLFLLESPPELEFGWLMTEALLDKLKFEVEKAGATLVLMLLPLEIQLRRDDFENFLEARNLSVESRERSLPQKRLEKWADESNVEVMNLLPAFEDWLKKGFEPLFLEEGHWSAEGHEVAAGVAGELLGALSAASKTAGRNGK